MVFFDCGSLWLRFGSEWLLNLTVFDLLLKELVSLHVAIVWNVIFCILEITTIKKMKLSC